jgi:4-hydroxy-3-methylbut-2-enyl diphosphate reductase
VIIPAFGATDEDKKKLVRKGIRVAQYDATCMLVEKVWKAARAFGREGYTVIIHGKASTRKPRPPSPIPAVSPLAHHPQSRRGAAHRRLISGALSAGERAGPFEEVRRAAHARLRSRDLDRIAVVNQTTLLMNETVEIIDYFKRLRRKYGAPRATPTWAAAARRTPCATPPRSTRTPSAGRSPNRSTRPS